MLLFVFSVGVGIFKNIYSFFIMKTNGAATSCFTVAVFNFTS